MNRSIAACGALALLSAAAPAQLDTAAPTFDAVAVRVSPRSEWVKDARHQLQGGYAAGGRYYLRRATMLDMVRLAFNVEADKIDGGPAWLDYDRYDIDAAIKPGTSQEALRLMLRTLLEQRFHLVVRQATRDSPAFVLSKGTRDVKWKEAGPPSRPPCLVSHSVSLGSGTSAVAHIECHAATMDQFAGALRSLLSSPLHSLPVVNSTGIEGAWDVEVQGPSDALSNGRLSADWDAAIERLGLKLESSKIPAPVLAVQSADETPTPDAAGLEKLLPPLPDPEFEVASVKWPCDGDRTTALRFETGGRVTGICNPVGSLIRQAWGLPIFEPLIGVPKSLTEGTTGNISVVAKTPADVAADPQHNAQARDVLSQMLRTLLIERYKIAFHYEERPVDAFTLAAVKPKLAKADPSGRTGCVRENQRDTANNGLLVKLVCRNMTIAQFAEQAPAFDPDIFYPVIDATRLSGAWDFVVTYDALASLNARFPQFSGRTAPANGDAADPIGALTFGQAMEKQIGLKLETHKRPQRVLVIDHMEEKPIAN